jgi:hypothetical protein
MGMTAPADWRKIPGRKIDKWIVGVDLGKMVDSTAIAVVHHTIAPTGEWIKNEKAQFWREKSVERFDLLHLERIALGTNYVTQARMIGEILTREPLKSANATLVVDQSGVGAGVVDLMEATGLRPIRLQITGGTETSQRDGRVWNVAKSALISKLEAAMHSTDLHVAGNLREADAFRDELRDFQRHVTATGANAWGARVGKHDDIVLAVSYCVWWATSGPKSSQQPLPWGM